MYGPNYSGRRNYDDCISVYDEHSFLYRQSHHTPVTGTLYPKSVVLKTGGTHRSSVSNSEFGAPKIVGMLQN